MWSLFGKIKKLKEFGKKTSDFDPVLRKRASPKLDVEGIRHWTNEIRRSRGSGSRAGIGAPLDGNILVMVIEWFRLKTWLICTNSLRRCTLSYRSGLTIRLGSI